MFNIAQSIWESLYFILFEMIKKFTQLSNTTPNPLADGQEENEDYRKLIRQGGLPMALPFEQGYRTINRSNDPPIRISQY